VTFFGHQHLNLSRVFTVNGVSYQVCLSCGTELEYDLATMQLTGTVIERPISHPDIVALARKAQSGAPSKRSLGGVFRHESPAAFGRSR
jgi:hypothetical protein